MNTPGVVHSIRMACALAMALSAEFALAAEPAVDGSFAEWTPTTLLTTDPAGDATGPLDLTAVSVQSRGTHLFVQLDLNNSLNLSSGPATDTSLRMTITRAPHSLTIDFRGRVAYLDGVPSNVVTWPTISFSSLPTVAANQFEMEVDAAIIGAAIGDPVQFSFQGADTLAANPNFTLTDGAAAPTRRSAAKPACATLRVASFNTFHTGLASAPRRAAFVRLIDSVNADVYCFQEEYNSSLAQVQSIINEADPLDDGAAWNVLKVGELAIASPYPLVQVTLGSAYLAAVVRQPGGNDTLVINNHLKCCGYAGNTDDAQRISQATAAIQSFNAFRAGTLSAPLATYRNVPALVVGDWNLVGSSTPLDLWLANPGPSLTHAAIPHLIGDEAWTWAAPSGTDFWPGILDLCVYDAARTRLVKAFTLDSAELTPTELTTLGLLAADSTASDHRLLILDFATGPNPDLNSDGTINTLDLTLLLSHFGQTVSPSTSGDINGDGQVNTLDLTALLARFGQNCP